MLDHFNVAVNASVGYIHDHTPVGSSPHLGSNLEVAVQDVVRIAVEGVGADVSRTQELQDIWQWYRRAADMDHQPGTRLVGNGPGRFHGFMGVPGGHRVDMHTDFDAKAETGVSLDGIRRLVNVDHAHVVESATQEFVVGQSNSAHMQKGQQAGAVCREHVIAHGFKVDEAGTTGIDAGGGPG